MRVDNSNFAATWARDVVDAAFVVEISFDEANTDLVYITSGSITGLTGTIYEGLLESVSGTSQKISPDKSLATIGSLQVRALDQGLTDLQRVKLGGGYGLRGKRVRFFVGAKDLDWSDYILATTQIMEDVEFLDGIYTFNTADIQRELRENIFDVKKTALSSSIAANASTIPVYTTEGFALVQQPVSPSGVTDASGQKVGYIKLNNGCVVRYTGKTANSFTGCTWGVLDTAHLIEGIEKSSGTNKDNAPAVEEYVYLEMPLPMMIYALCTGSIYGYPGEFLPDHWNLGITAQYIRTSDFENIGTDIWDLANFDEGLPAVVRGHQKVDGKKFIEEELLPLAGLICPVYSNGELGLKRKAVVFSTGSYIRELNESNVVRYGTLKHNMGAVINQVRLQWGYDEQTKEYRRLNIITDSASISKHGEAKPKELKFKTLHGSRHAFNAIKNQFDSLRDAYAGPPLELSLTLLPEHNDLEVGDIVRVRLDNVKDYTGETVSLDRNFEIHQVQTDWRTGRVNLSLFGSSQPASAVAPQEEGSAVQNSWYNSAGTEINPANFPGAVTEVAGLTRITGDITLNGNGDLNSSGSIYYCNQALTIDDTVKVTVNQQIQLRVRGFFQVNGEIDGKGRGIVGAAGGMDGPGSGIGATLGGDGVAFFIGGQARLQSWGTRGSPTANKLVPSNLSLQVNAVGNLRGIPSDIRGNGGTGGGACLDRYPSPDVVAPGGAGGNGGAGLLVVCRGADIGANGKIDTSGDDGQMGNALELDGISNAYIKSGSGGGGAPGAVYFVIDGFNNPPNITTLNCKARYGLSPVDDGSYLVAGRDHISDYVGSSWDPRYRGIDRAVGSIHVGTYLGPDRVYSDSGKTLRSATGLAANMAESWYRVQILTGYIQPVQEVKYSSPPTQLILTEATNSPPSATGSFSTIEASVTAPADDAYSYAFIQYRKAGQSGWTTVGAASPEATQIVIADGSTYEFRASSVSTSGLRSQSYITNTITVSDLAQPATVDTVLPLLDPVIALKQGGTTFDGRDVHIVFSDTNYTKEHFAHYQMEVYKDGGATLVRTEQFSDRKYTYSSEMNLEDGNFRDITFRVKAIGKQGQESGVVSLAVSNPAPLAPSGVTISPGSSSGQIKFNPPADDDYQNFDVWVSTSTPVAENSGNYVGQFYGSAVSVSGLDPETQYYVRIRLNDVFGAGPYSEVGFLTDAVPGVGDLSPWATLEGSADAAFIAANVDPDAIASDYISGLVAGKIQAGVISATIGMGTSGIFQAENGNIRTTLGKKLLGGKTALLSADNNGTKIFAINEDGTAELTAALTIQSGSTGFGNLGDIPDRLGPTATTGLNLTDTHLGYYDGTGWKVSLDSSGNLSIGGAGFGGNGIQQQYNAGNPRSYIGDGDQQYLKYEDGNLSLGPGTSILGLPGYAEDDASFEFYYTLNNVLSETWAISTEDVADMVYESITGLRLRERATGGAANSRARVRFRKLNYLRNIFRGVAGSGPDYAYWTHNVFQKVVVDLSSGIGNGQALICGDGGADITDAGDFDVLPGFGWHYSNDVLRPFWKYGDRTDPNSTSVAFGPSISHASFAKNTQVLEIRWLYQPGTVEWRLDGSVVHTATPGFEPYIITYPEDAVVAIKTPAGETPQNDTYLSVIAVKALVFQ